MAGLSVQYTDLLLDKIFRNVDFVFTPYISFHTGDPGVTGRNEVLGGGYARVSAASPQIFGNPPSAGSLASTVAVSIANMPACTVSYFGVFDAATNGNFVCGGILKTPISIASGQTIACAPSQLSIGFDDTASPTAWSPYLRNLILAYAFQGTQFSVATFYMSLHSATPGTNGASEINGGPGPYARQTVAFTAAATSQNSNTNQVLFPGIPGGNVTNVAFWDALTNGNFLVSAPVSMTTSFNSGDTAQFPVGSIVNLLT